MKTILLVVVSAAVGIGLGAGAAIIELGGPNDGIGFSGNPDAPRPTPSGEPQPRVVIDHETYDFGAMQRGSTNQHKFLFTNDGQGPLRLVVGDTTCKCTVGDVSGEDILPGGAVPVTLEWTAKTLAPEFRQSATILTNDSFRPRVTLTVFGKIRQAATFVPSVLALGSVRRGAGKTAHVDLIAYQETEIEVLSHKWRDLPDEYLDVDIQSLDRQDFIDAEVKAATRITISLKPGAPTGILNGWLLVTTNLTALPRAEIGISGKVVSDISFSGPGYNAEKDLLVLGAVNQDEGVERRLVAFVRGEHALDTQLELAHVEPDFLDVRVGEAVIRTERVTQIPIAIRVPVGTRPVAFLGEGHGGYGRIILKTTHPEIPQLEIMVRFTVGQ